MKKIPFLVCLLCLVPLCAYFFDVFYGETQKTAVRQLNEEQLIHARQASQGIEDFFLTWTGILNSFAKMHEIINIDKDGKRYMALLQEAHQEQIRSITRMDESGLILHTVPFAGLSGSDISNQKHIIEIVRTHKPVISDVFKAVQGFEGVALHVPVFEGETFKGTIAVVVDFEKLAKRYLAPIKIGKTGHAWMLGGDGTTLYSPISGFTGKSVFDNYKNYPAILSMARDMLNGGNGHVSYEFDGIGDKTGALTKKFAVYMPVRIVDGFWSIVVESSEDDVFSSLVSFRNKLIMLSVVILFSGALFSILGAKAWFIIAEENKRKAAEAKLQESEQYNRLLFELSPIGLALCRMDGSLVDVNPAYAEIIGRTISETLTLSYWDITPRIYAEQEQFQLDNLSATGRYGPYEKEYIDKNGNFVSVRLYGRIIEKHGEQFIWSSVENITDKKNAEKTLKKNERILCLFVEHSPAAIAMFDRDMKYIVASRRFLEDYELGSQEVVGRSHYEVFPEIPERWKEIHRRCLAGATAKSEEDPFPRADGSMDWIRWEILPWHENENKIGGIILFSEVITESKKVRDELEQHRNHLEELIKQRTADLEARTNDLQQTQQALHHLLENVNKAKKELEAKVAEIERINKVFVDRELRMVELKEKIKVLEKNAKNHGAVS